MLRYPIFQSAGLHLDKIVLPPTSAAVVRFVSALSPLGVESTRKGRESGNHLANKLPNVYNQFRFKFHL